MVALEDGGDKVAFPGCTVDMDAVELETEWVELAVEDVVGGEDVVVVIVVGVGSCFVVVGTVVDVVVDVIVVVVMTLEVVAGVAAVVLVVVAVGSSDELEATLAGGAGGGITDKVAVAPHSSKDKPFWQHFSLLAQ